MAYLALPVGTLELCECGAKYEISEAGRKSLPAELRDCKLIKIKISETINAVQFVSTEGKVLGEPCLVTVIAEKVDFPFDFESYSCPVDE